MSKKQGRRAYSARNAVGRPPGVLGGDVRKCSRKKAMLKSTALKVGRRKRKELGEPIYAYECDECGAWHIGHSWDREQHMKGEAG